MRATSAGAGVDGIEVLLITSSGGKGLVFPKVSCVVNANFLTRLLAQAGGGEAIC